MAMMSTLIERRDGRTLTLVRITEPPRPPGDTGLGPADEIYELSCTRCGANIAQVERESDARDAWSDPCPSKDCCGCDPLGTHHCLDKTPQ